MNKHIRHQNSGITSICPKTYPVRRFKAHFGVLLATTMLIPAACGQVTPGGTSQTYNQSFPNEYPNEYPGQEPSTPSISVGSSSAPHVTNDVAVKHNKSIDNLAEPKGLSNDLLNNRRLFDQPISDPIARIRRIEIALQDLRDDFDTAIPAMAGLVVSEAELAQVLEDLKRSGDIAYTDISPAHNKPRATSPYKPVESTALSKTIDRLEAQHAAPAHPPIHRPVAKVPALAAKPTALQGADTQGSDKVVAKDSVQDDAVKRIAERIAANSAKKPAETMHKAKPASHHKMAEKHVKNDHMPNDPHVLNIRVGDYPDKTRIVLDLSAPAKYMVDLDNQEKLLILEVKDTKWAAKTAFTFKNSPLLSAYTAQSADASGHSRLLITLKTPVKIAKKFILKSDKSRNLKDRIVLDLVKK